MERESIQASYLHKTEGGHEDRWRHQCGCIRTSEKLKEILKSFPNTPPPSPSHYEFPNTTLTTTCISAYCTGAHQSLPYPAPPESLQKQIPLEPTPVEYEKKVASSKTWRMVAELVQLLQLSVTATALALYYLIYCYMQLVYYTLRSALYFHNADGPMKITIGVVTVTSVIVAFNLILRIERLIGIF